MTEPELQRAIVHVIRTHLGPSPAVKIFLFGSRATGQHTLRSDYDIGIEAAAPIPLEMLGRIQADLDELPVLPKIDVVDLRRVGAAFKQAALTSVIQWDEKCGSGSVV
jgi:predicted nucleotidyltransferase